MDAFFHLILFILLGVAVVTDVRRRLIPNRIPLAIIALFIAAALAGAVPHWPEHLLAFAAAFAVCVGLFALGWLGGGDAKLIPAVVLWVGVSALPLFLVAMTVFGGILALILLIRRWRTGRATTLPYAVAIAAGALPVLGEPILNAFRASFSHI